jgi:hypothetical protein
MLKIEEKPSCQQRTAANWGFILVWSFTFLYYFSASLSFSLQNTQSSAVRETLWVSVFAGLGVQLGGMFSPAEHLKNVGV